MIASLPMYDAPVLHAAWDAFWRDIATGLQAAGLTDVPMALTGGDDLWAIWDHPQLLLAQTCGLPFRTRRASGHSLFETRTLLGAFDFGLPDTPPGWYHSVFIARTDDARHSLNEFAGAHLAYNDPLSQSGWAAVVDTGLQFQLGSATGSHAGSLRAVASGQADIAALDAVSWRLLQHTDPQQASAVRVVARSDPRPGLPLITADAALAEMLITALAKSAAAPPKALADILGLAGFVVLDAADYLALDVPPAPAAYVAGQD